MAVDMAQSCSVTVTFFALHDGDPQAQTRGSMRNAGEDILHFATFKNHRALLMPVRGRR